MEARIKHIKEQFVEKFGCKPTDIFSSPGRIELLGNHTDHNNGMVLVSSIDLCILAAVRPTKDNKITFISEGYKKMVVKLEHLERKRFEFGKSIALIKGVAYKCKELGYNVGGFEVFCNSTIFKGAGVSSSAAFEVLIAKIISYYYNNDSIPALELAKIAQFSEAVYFNKPCGLLDQSGIALGGINFIDFKSIVNPKVEQVQWNSKDYQFVLINTGDDHSKLTHCYAAIKDDMKKVSEYFSQKVLRFVSKKKFNEHKDDIIAKHGENAYLRAKHYLEENYRVQKAFKYLKEDNYHGFLKQLSDSGESSYYQLKNCYVKDEKENLPSALRYAKSFKGCYSRVHGGGFAGTMLMVIPKDKLDNILSTLIEKFTKENVMLVSLSDKGTTHLLEVID